MVNNRNEEEEETNNKIEQEELRASLDIHDFLAKNRCTGTLTMTAAGNGTCIITLRLNDFKAQTSLSLFLRHHPSKNNQNQFNKTRT